MNKQLIALWLILVTLTLGGCNNSHSGGGGSNFDLHQINFVVSQPSLRQTGSVFELGRIRVTQVNPDVVVAQTMQAPSIYPNQTSITSLRGVFIASDPSLTGVEYHLMVDGVEVASAQVITNVEVVIPVGFTLVGSRSYDVSLIVYGNVLIPSGTLEFMPVELTKTGVSVSLPFALAAVQCNPGGNQLPAANYTKRTNDTLFVNSSALLYEEDVNSVYTLDQDLTDYTFNVLVPSGFQGVARLLVDGIEKDSVKISGANGTPIPFKLYPGEVLFSATRRNIRLVLDGAGCGVADTLQVSRISFGTNGGFWNTPEAGLACLCN